MLAIEPSKLGNILARNNSDILLGFKSILKDLTDMGNSTNISHITIDPCNDFQCTAESVPATHGLCRIFEKHQFDYNCFIPCHIDNCTAVFVPGHLCTEYFCNPAPSPSPPDPFTTTQGPNPVTEPAPSLTFPAVVGISCAGKDFYEILLCIIYRIQPK